MTVTRRLLEAEVPHNTVCLPNPAGVGRPPVLEVSKAGREQNLLQESLAERVGLMSATYTNLRSALGHTSRAARAPAASAQLTLATPQDLS